MEAEQFDKEKFQAYLKSCNLATIISSISFNELREENWNETWESDYDAVEIGKECYIRAPFHPEKSGFEQSLVIVPKMSFGTGHHSTTRLMVQQMLKLNFSDKEVLYFNSGNNKDLAMKIEWAYANYEVMLEKAEKAYRKLIEDYQWRIFWKCR